MTVAALIEQFNTERPNNVEDTLKIHWLKECEHMIVIEVINTHEHDKALDEKMSLNVVGSTLYINSGGDMDAHINNFDLDTELLVPDPFTGVYTYYLDQRIALNQNDTKRYNAAATAYNNAYLNYQEYYNRTHMPLKPSKKTLNHSHL